jgi:hypothetical protein
MSCRRILREGGVSSTPAGFISAGSKVVSNCFINIRGCDSSVVWGGVRIVCPNPGVSLRQRASLNSVVFIAVSVCVVDGRTTSTEMSTARKHLFLFYVRTHEVCGEMMTKRVSVVIM